MARKPLRISNNLSLAVARVFPSRRQSDGTISSGAMATGSIWAHAGSLHLITNWHNLTGWDALNDRALSAVAFTPNMLVVEVPVKTTQAGQPAFAWARFEIDILDAQDRPIWTEHPTFGRRVDVVAVPFSLPQEHLAEPPVNLHDFVDFDANIGDEAFVLGYPRGLSGGAKLPIWKRASIASEPDIDVDGLPKLLVDTATRQGMSGAPVVVMRRGHTRPRGAVVDASGFSLQDIIMGVSTTLLGVYSGRIGDDELGAQLGVVWKKRAVNEVIQHGRPGTLPHDQDAPQ